MKPVLCSYYLTLRCNSKCTYCNVWSTKENYQLKEQKLDIIGTNLRDLKRLGVKMVDFTGGEPLLYHYIVDALKIAKSMGFYTTVTTNCLLYSRFASKLVGLIDILQFSFDAVDREEHNSSRGVNCYDKVLDSIKLAKNLKQRVNLIHTVTNQNYQAIPKMVRFAQANKCTLAINPCFEYFDNEPLQASVVSFVRRFFNEPYVVMDLANLRLIEEGGNNVDDPVCKAINSVVVISPDNKLLLPCWHHSIEKIDINNQLFELYHSARVEKIKDDVGKYDFCKNCTIYCYMRASLHRKVWTPYFPLAMVSGYKYLRERYRSQS